MTKKYKLFFIFFIISIHSNLKLYAQDDYKYEIGGMAGINFYIGDANKMRLFNDIGATFGGVFRYNIDLQWSIKTNLLFGNISGNTKNSKNVFPHGQQQSFERFFGDLGTQIEYNFFSYSDQFEYLGAKKMTPYVFVGLGMTFGSGNKTFFDANIPFGVGFKYKLKERLNIGFEFSFRRLFSDSFDVTDREGLELDDPYEIKSTFKNKDWYSLTMFSITWNFGQRPCPCLNIE